MSSRAGNVVNKLSVGNFVSTDEELTGTFTPESSSRGVEKRVEPDDSNDSGTSAMADLVKNATANGGQTASSLVVNGPSGGGSGGSSSAGGTGGGVGGEGGGASGTGTQSSGLLALGSAMMSAGSRKRAKSKSENRAHKALRTISFILGAFVLCWTPYHICALIEGFCRNEKGCVNHHLFYFFYFLCYANSPINPFCVSHTELFFFFTVFFRQNDFIFSPHSNSTPWPINSLNAHSIEYCEAMYIEGSPKLDVRTDASKKKEPKVTTKQDCIDQMKGFPDICFITRIMYIPSSPPLSTNGLLYTLCLQTSPKLVKVSSLKV